MFPYPPCKYPYRDPFGMWTLRLDRALANGWTKTKLFGVVPVATGTDIVDRWRVDGQVRW